MKKKRLVVFAVSAACICMFITYMGSAQPGSADDPVVTLSYIEQVLTPRLDAQQSFQVVAVNNGQVLEGADGTELIMRMGKATVISTDKGGIADVTSGTDLWNGSAVPANHHLIIPLGDGRGVQPSEDCLFMVKGKYEIK